MQIPDFMGREYRALTRYRPAYRCDHFRLLPNGRLNGDLKVGKGLPDRRYQLRQVFLQVSAHAEEHRHDPQGPHAFAMQRRGAGWQRGLHQLQEREHDALAGQQLAEFGYELLERPRPLRVARTVGEKDKCSLGHEPIICDRATSR